MTSTRRHKLLKHQIYLALKRAKDDGTEELSAASIVDSILANGFRLQGVGIQRVAQICKSLAGIAGETKRIQHKHLDVEQNVKLYRLESEEDYLAWRSSLATR